MFSKADVLFQETEGITFISMFTVKGIVYYKIGRFFLIHLVFFTEWLMGRKTPKPGEDQHLNNPGGKVAQKAFKLPYQ